MSPLKSDSSCQVGCDLVSEGTHVGERVDRPNGAVDLQLGCDLEREAASLHRAVRMFDGGPVAGAAHGMQHAETDAVASEGTERFTIHTKLDASVVGAGDACPPQKVNIALLVPGGIGDDK